MNKSIYHREKKQILSGGWISNEGMYKITSGRLQIVIQHLLNNFSKCYDIAVKNADNAIMGLREF